MDNQIRIPADRQTEEETAFLVMCVGSGGWGWIYGELENTLHQ